jgi:hypothetical protein
MAFEMRVVELFKFQDGRAVLSGPVIGNERYIKPCRAALWVGHTCHVISLDGEMMPSPPPPNGYRAVSTRSDVPFDSAQLKQMQCRLVKITEPE